MVTASTQIEQRASTSVLAISFAFPPMALPRSIQVARLLKHLDARVSVICCQSEKGIRNDPTIEPGVESHLKAIFRVPFEPGSVRSLAGRVAERFNLPLINQTPDRYVPWGKPAMERARLFIGSADKQEMFTILSFGHPMSDHLIGLKLKAEFRLPWVAHFSDPWVGNPYFETKQDPLTRARNRTLEEKVISLADRLVFTSEETVDMTMSRYPAAWRKKARVLPQCYDSGRYGRQRASTNSSIIIRHTGWFYGPRTPKPLVAALKLLREVDAAILDQVRFELIGTIEGGALAESGASDLPADLLLLKPPVNYEESLSLISDADGLLVIDAPAEKSVFLPSKLVDYIGAGRPILGITPPGAAQKLVRELGGWLASPDSPQEIAEALSSFIAFLKSARNDAPTEWGNNEIRQRYEAGRVAGELLGILNDAATNG